MKKIEKLSGKNVADMFFLDTRANLISLAAAMDRIERLADGPDYRAAALSAAAKILGDEKPERTRRILELFSDPTTVPTDGPRIPKAVGAFDPAFLK